MVSNTDAWWFWRSEIWYMAPPRLDKNQSLSRLYSFLEVLGKSPFPAHLAHWQNSDPCSCRPQASVCLLAISWGLLLTPVGHHRPPLGGSFFCLHLWEQTDKGLGVFHDSVAGSFPQLQNLSCRVISQRLAPQTVWWELQPQLQVGLNHIESSPFSWKGSDILASWRTFGKKKRKKRGIVCETKNLKTAQNQRGIRLVGSHYWQGHGMMILEVLWKKELWTRILCPAILLFKKIYLFIWLCWVLVTARRILLAVPRLLSKLWWVGLAALHHVGS